MAEPRRTAVEEIASLYSSVAADYVAKGPPYFAHAGKRLVELAGVRAGDVVLDLGTGRGAVLLPAAKRVGASGSALGVDIAPGMLEHTRRAIQDQHLQNVSVLRMDVAHLQVPAREFSHVLSSFSVFFFPNLPEVLQALLERVLRPGGTAGFAFSRGTDPRWTWYEDRLRQLGAFEGLVVPRGYPRVREPGVLTTLLDHAGFIGAHEIEEETDLWYASPEAWWQSLWTHGSRRALERLAPDVLKKFEEEAIARVQRELLQSQGVPERMRLVYVLARAPA